MFYSYCGDIYSVKQFNSYLKMNFLWINPVDHENNKYKEMPINPPYWQLGEGFVKKQAL